MTWISLRKKLKSCLPTLYTANIPVMVRIAKKQRDSECNGGKEGFQHQKYCSIFIKKFETEYYALSTPNNFR